MAVFRQLRRLSVIDETARGRGPDKPSSISIRAEVGQGSLSGQAAERLDGTRSDFMPEAACRQARAVLLDQSFFTLNTKAFAAPRAVVDGPLGPRDRRRRRLRASTGGHGGSGLRRARKHLQQTTTPVAPAPHPLTERHHLGNFECVALSFADWLRRRAAERQTGGTWRSYPERESDVVAGHNCLAVGAAGRADATVTLAHRWANPVSVRVPGRLALDRRRRQKGIGTAPVNHAIRSARQTVGARHL